MTKTSLLGLLVLSMLVLKNNLVYAEYRAVTKFTSVERGGDEDGEPPKFLSAEIDEVDEKACFAITENINAMQRYRIQWECDFPISANNYLLTKPQWVEVVGEERRKALDVISPNRTDPDGDYRPVYGFPYNVDTVEGDEKIYIRPQIGLVCEAGSTQSRVSFWFSENNDLNSINNDPVMYASRMYFVEYGRNGKYDKIFNVATLKKRLSSSSTKKNQFNVCEIRPTASR